LGFNPKELGSPFAAAWSSLLTFAAGALIPLLPWFWWSGTSAVVSSIALSTIAALFIGGYLGQQTGKGIVWSAIRQVLIVAAAAALTYLVGRIFRVRVS
jgi:vacuolar iron transporter family protein